MISNARRNSQTLTQLVDSLFCITCSLENNAFSVLHYVIKVTLHYYNNVTSIRDSFCPGTFAHFLLGLIRLYSIFFADLVVPFYLRVIVRIWQVSASKKASDCSPGFASANTAYLYLQVIKG